MCLARKTSRTKKAKVRDVATRIAPVQAPVPRAARRMVDQPTLYDYFILPGGDDPRQTMVQRETIEASGDEMIQIEEDTLRVALQNPNGIRLRDNVQVLPEVAAITQLGIDIAVFPETKLARGGRTVEVLRRQLSTQSSVRVIHSAAPRQRVSSSEYQPGGVLMAITGRTTGRCIKGYADPWGRYIWYKLRGNRREGVIVIGGYRCSQKKGTVAGASTAYMQQIGEMLQEELRDVQAHQEAGTTIPLSVRRSLDPRARLLSDLKTVIEEARSEGYRPILAMDANEDWTSPSGKQLSSFLTEVGLVDPLYDRFCNQGLTKSTYARGSSRIDFIFVDKALAPAIKRIGTLGLHEAMFSDHVMVYADIDESLLFDGQVNRPVRVPNREFMLSQADKCEIFIKAFKKLAQDFNFKKRIESIEARMAVTGPSEMLVLEYNNLDSEIMRRILECAKKCIKKKYGYARSPELGAAGLVLNFWKSVHSSKLMQKSLPQATIRLADKLAVPLQNVATMTRNVARRHVNAACIELRDVQVRASEKRQGWIERNSQDVARAAGEPDWRKHMEKMLREEREREVNRKLTNIVKGPHQSLDWIEVPVGEWFYSHTNKEIYRFHRGVFECYAAWTPSPSLIPSHPWKFYSHHHLKVPHDDIVHAQVRTEDEWLILEAIFRPMQIWRTVTDASEIEELLLERNCRHLQQAVVEEGRTHDPLIQSMMGGYGTDLLQDVKDGTMNIDEATDEFIAAWLQALKQTPEEAALAPILGIISKEAFQEAFKRVGERTSSAGIHYTLWKCLARDDECSEWLSKMMSLPFQHGFLNQRWTKSIDVMLEKKKGVRRIHMLRIIALLEADFNTALKILFAKRLMDNAESSGLSDEQWGSRRNRMALDPAMKNLMTFEYGRYMRATIAMFAADLTACFDRVYPALSNVVCGKFGMDINVLKCKGLTMDKMEHSVRTGHGVSINTYGNRPGQPKKAGEGQGKGDVAITYALQSSTLLDAHANFMKDLISLHQSLGRGFPSEMTGMLTMSTHGHRNSSTVLIRQNMLCISLNVALKL